MLTSSSNLEVIIQKKSDYKTWVKDDKEFEMNRLVVLVKKKH